jgi:hypothetical protein
MEICTKCFQDVHAQATTCPACQATRRKPGGNWTAYRDGRRNDILAAGLALVVVLSIISWALLAIAGTSSRSTISTCTRSSAAYPYC